MIPTINRHLTPLCHPFLQLIRFTSCTTFQTMHLRDNVALFPPLPPLFFVLSWNVKFSIFTSYNNIVLYFIPISPSLLANSALMWNYNTCILFNLQTCIIPMILNIYRQMSQNLCHYVPYNCRKFLQLETANQIWCYISIKFREFALLHTCCTFHVQVCELRLEEPVLHRWKDH